MTGQTTDPCYIYVSPVVRDKGLQHATEQNHKENIYLLSSTTVSIPSSELGLPTPSPASECVPPPEPKGEVTNSPAGEGGGGGGGRFGSMG